MKWIPGFLLVLIALDGPAQTLTRKVVFKKGQAFERIVVVKSTNILSWLGSETEVINNISQYITTTVTDVTDAGYVLENKITRKIVTITGMGRDNFFDSDSTDDAGDNLLRGKLMEDVGKVTRIVVGREGKIVSSEDTLKMEEEAAGLGALSNLVNAAKRPGQNYELIPKLPDGTIKTGREWSDSENIDGNKALVNYKLESVTEEEAVITHNGTVTNSVELETGGVKTVLKTNSSVTGSFTMDPRTGLLKQSTIETVAAGTMEVMGQPIPMKMKMETTQTVTPRKL